MPTTPSVLLADADVLIDYRESELAILSLVVQHLGQVAVVPSVLEEVRGVTAAQCARLGIEVIEVTKCDPKSPSKRWGYRAVRVMSSRRASC